MRFRVYKSSFEGISGGGADLSAEQVEGELSDYRGWPSREALLVTLRKWAKSAKPGSSFSTQGSVVVCEASVGVPEECSDCLSNDIEYGEFESHEDGHLTQDGHCKNCGERWTDTFYPASRRVHSRT